MILLHCTIGISSTASADASVFKKEKKKNTEFMWDWLWEKSHLYELVIAIKSQFLFYLFLWGFLPIGNSTFFFLSFIWFAFCCDNNKKKVIRIREKGGKYEEIPWKNRQPTNDLWIFYWPLSHSLAYHSQFFYLNATF